MGIVRTASALHPSHPLYYLPSDAESLIDVGCNVGALIAHAHAMGIRRSFGIDINGSAVDAAKHRLASLKDSTELTHASADAIPAADGTFDVATCCEVLEHVPEEFRPKVISELHRVLRPGGRLILTTPAAGLFAFLDPSNMRFRFSRLYHVAHRLARGKGRDVGYEGQKHGVVWHEHFPHLVLRNLLSPFFEIESIRYRGVLLNPLCNMALFPFYRRQRLDAWPARMLVAMKDFEMRRDPGRLLGYNVLIVARAQTH